MQYASFVPRSDVTAGGAVKYDVTLHKSCDDVTSHLTTLNFPPQEGVGGADLRLYEARGPGGGSPDVLYSPRMLRCGYQNNVTCEACCRSCSQSVAASHASVYHSQDLLHATYGKYLPSTAGAGTPTTLLTYGRRQMTAGAGDAGTESSSPAAEVRNISGNCALYDTVSNLSSDQVVSV